MVGPVAGDQQGTPTGGHVVLFTLDPRQRVRQYALGRDGARSDHGQGQHARERSGQFLRAARRSAGDGRDDVGGFSGHVDRLRQVPQPPAREVDERSILRHGEPVRPGAHEVGFAQRRPHRVCLDRRGRDSTADRSTATAATAGWRSAAVLGARRSAGGAGEMADRAGKSLLFKGDRQSNLGQLHGRGAGRRGGRPARKQSGQQ